MESNPPRSVKYWCSNCARSERDTRKAYFRQCDAERQRELQEMQARLIRQAQSSGNAGTKNDNNNNNRIDDDREEPDEEEEEGDKPQQEATV